jgi:hypothetical protein
MIVLAVVTTVRDLAQEISVKHDISSAFAPLHTVHQPLIVLTSVRDVCQLMTYNQCMLYCANNGLHRLKLKIIRH